MELNIKITNINKDDAQMIANMFKIMETCGSIGASRELKIYADGDGSCRPKIVDIKGYTKNKEGDTITHNIESTVSKELIMKSLEGGPIAVGFTRLYNYDKQGNRYEVTL